MARGGGRRSRGGPGKGVTGRGGWGGTTAGGTHLTFGVTKLVLLIVNNYKFGHLLIRSIKKTHSRFLLRYKLGMKESKADKDRSRCSLERRIF